MEEFHNQAHGEVSPPLTTALSHCANAYHFLLITLLFAASAPSNLCYNSVFTVKSVQSHIASSRESALPLPSLSLRQTGPRPLPIPPAWTQRPCRLFTCSRSNVRRYAHKRCWTSGTISVPSAAHALNGSWPIGNSKQKMIELPTKLAMSNRP